MDILTCYNALVIPTKPDLIKLRPDILQLLALNNSVLYIQADADNSKIDDSLYYQLQAMMYALLCEEEYYLVWDANILPCHEISMFDKESSIPYLDLCDYDDAKYLSIVSILLPGIKKTIPRSFASGHMLIRTDIMRSMIADIEKNPSLPGDTFSDKIINCCNECVSPIPLNLYVLYGIYTATKYPRAYKPRIWKCLQNGTNLLLPKEINNDDLSWLSKSFDSIAFYNDHKYIQEYAELFHNQYYRNRLTPLQIINAIYNTDTEEVHTGSDDFSPEDRLKYLNNDTYKTYEQLGDDYIGQNPDQAYLCYENALFLCNDKNALTRISSKKRELTATENIRVNKVAIIIVSYNNIAFTRSCLESIYTNCDLENCLVMIFDNGSTDGSQEWLQAWGESHEEAIVILNDSNLGFAGGNNACCKYLPSGYDIFYLNNDTRIPANALFWMRMALYSSDDVGGVGAVQNYAKGDQLEDVYFDLPEQYVEYGAKHNIYEQNPYEEQSKICGFAMLITREMYDKTGGFDEQFNPGFLEDDDLSLQIRTAGKKLILCQNAFIYHAGSQSFRKRDDINDLFKLNRDKIVSKWGFDPTLYAAMSENEYAFIMSLERKGYNRSSKFSLVHIASGCGNMLGHIHYLYPNAVLAGVEENAIAKRYAISCIPVVSSIEELPIPLDEYDIVAKNLG